MKDRQVIENMSGELVRQNDIFTTLHDKTIIDTINVQKLINLDHPFARNHEKCKPTACFDKPVRMKSDGYTSVGD